MCQPLLLALVLLQAAPTAADETPQASRLAIMPLEAQRVAEETVNILDSLLLEAVGRASLFAVMSTREVNAMLGFERMKDAAGCSDASCAVEIGGALGVRYLLTGSVSRLGDEFVVQLSFVDVEKVAIVKRGRGIARDDERLYRYALELAVADIFETKKPTPPAAPADESAVTTPATTAPEPAVPMQPDNTPGPKYVFQTNLDLGLDAGFTVTVASGSGALHSCGAKVAPGATCTLHGIAPGRGRLMVSAPHLNPFSKPVRIKDSGGLQFFSLQKQPAAGSVIAWTFGGTALALGTGLLLAGLTTDTNGLKIASIPTAVVGGGLLALGFQFDSDIHVDYPGWDWWEQR